MKYFGVKDTVAIVVLERCGANELKEVVFCSPQPLKRRINIIAALITMMLISQFFLSAIPVLSSISLGALISEKLLGRVGVVDSSLLIGRAGVSTELSVLGFAPVISSQPVGATVQQTATLRGTVANMNGMPSAIGYFQWGYSASNLNHTTATFPITATGNYSSTITGFTQSEAIYYRFVTDADGTAYGNVVRFVASAGTGGFILRTILRVLMALVICIGVMMWGSRGGIALLISAIIGLIAFVMVDAFLKLIL